MANKKRTLCLIGTLMALALGALPALAETGKLGKWEVHHAQEVDLSHLSQEHGQLTGIIETFRPKADPRILRVDCPVPGDFAPEQQAALTVEYKRFNKEELIGALKAVGADPGQGKISLYGGRDAPGAIFRGEDLLSAFFTGHAKSVMAEGGPEQASAKRDEMEAAHRTAASFLRALGFEPYEPGMSASPLYDPQTYGLERDRSDWRELQEENNRECMRSRRRLDRTDFNYTVVSSAVMLNGLPAYDLFFWPSGDEREPEAITGDSTRADIAVKDGGILAEVSLSSLPIFKSAKPLSQPLHTWQEALREFIATYWVDHANPADTLIRDALKGREATAYATYTVLTELKPAYMSSQKNTYVPAWCFILTRRLQKDDSFVSMEVRCLDAATLDNISMLAFK